MKSLEYELGVLAGSSEVTGEVVRWLKETNKGMEGLLMIDTSDALKLDFMLQRTKVLTTMCELRLNNAEKKMEELKSADPAGISGTDGTG